MTAYSPTFTTAPPMLPAGPKMAYEIGDAAWIHAGLRDKSGNPRYSGGKVVFWFDLPDLVQRFYVIRLSERDFMHLMTRDATVMAPTATAGFPFTRTRHDENDRASDHMQDWRNS